MNKHVRALRIAITSLLVVYGLLSISQSGFALMHWLVKPDERPEAWLQVALVAGGRSLLVMVLAVAVQFSWQQFTQGKWLKLSLILASLAFAGPNVYEFWQVNQCQEVGGQWLVEEFRCG